MIRPGLNRGRSRFSCLPDMRDVDADCQEKFSTTHDRMQFFQYDGGLVLASAKKEYIR